ncbi:hypothetical protein BpHYR1_012002 [Brachionus plicatilis]|uniref:Uncharacterized protein n=1 Tax=Brachionus plicatilis TaxID=10195 RepID=A0A3M7PWK1_BRAPC|nr:hypothetical protein BpHYR1_012002 [Brachionus plicatilis]
MYLCNKVNFNVYRLYDQITQFTIIGDLLVDRIRKLACLIIEPNCSALKKWLSNSLFLELRFIHS